MKNIRYLLLLSYIFIRCNGEQHKFETDFYQSISKANSQITLEFDLSTITNFNWDAFTLLKGNESVPIFVKEIVPFIPEENEDVPVDHDRFYFFLNNKLVKKFDILNDHSSQQYDLENCGSIKMKRSDCIFRMKANTKNIEDGTVFLVPECIELPDFMKNESSIDINKNSD